MSHLIRNHTYGLAIVSTTMGDPSPTTEMVNVFAENFEKEFLEFVDVVKSGYSTICFDTEFPGFPEPWGLTAGLSQCDKHVEHMWNCAWRNQTTNVIQLGITVGDENMNIYNKSWQFNFKFILKNMRSYQPAIIEMLKEAGIDFDVLESEGIDYNEFTRLFKSSGLLKTPNVYWVTYFGLYDYGYLLKNIYDGELWKDYSSSAFPKLVLSYFPRSFDVRYIQNEIPKFSSQKKLVELASSMGIQISNLHQAGWDSRMTLQTLFAVRKRMIEKYGLHATREFFEKFGNIVFRSGIYPCRSCEVSGTAMKFCETEPEIPYCGNGSNYDCES